MNAITSIASDGTFVIGSTAERLLTPGEVAALFHVDPKTVNRWAQTDLLTSVRTPSGQRRYREGEVRALLNGGRK